MQAKVKNKTETGQKVAKRQIMVKSDHLLKSEVFNEANKSESLL